MTVTDLRLRAVRKAVHDWQEVTRPARPMLEELRTLQPEIERMLPILEAELPPIESLEFRRLERDAMALAARLQSLEARIRHALPGFMEFVTERIKRSSEASTGDDSGHD